MIGIGGIWVGAPEGLSIGNVSTLRLNFEKLVGKLC